MMEAFEAKVKVWATSQEEADELGRAMQDFVNELGAQGYAVTAEKTTKALRGWSSNTFVKYKILTYYRDEGPV